MSLQHTNCDRSRSNTESYNNLVGAISNCPESITRSFILIAHCRENIKLIRTCYILFFPSPNDRRIMYWRYTTTDIPVTNRYPTSIVLPFEASWLKTRSSNVICSLMEIQAIFPVIKDSYIMEEGKEYVLG